MTDKKPEHIRPIEHLGGKKPPAPDWFNDAVNAPSEEGEVMVDGGAIRFSAWGEVGKRGLLFVHGGRAHRGWWRPFAPFFTKHFRVAALDMSGMGDSDWRATYSLTQKVDEIFAVIEAAKLNKAGRPIVVGHSFGGWVTLAAVEQGGEKLSGAIVIDSPITVPDPDEGYTITKADGGKSPKIRKNRVYDTIEEPISRFRFLPNQPCDKPYMVDHIARNGLVKAPKEGGGTGWTWKFDPAHGSNFEIHFDRDLFLAARCPLAFFYGSDSAFVGGDGFDHLSRQAKGRSPFVIMPAVHHHLMMEEPLGFIAALRTLLSTWPIRVGAG